MRRIFWDCIGIPSPWVKIMDLIGYVRDEPPPPVTLAEYEEAVRQGEQLFWPGERMANIVDDPDGEASRLKYPPMRDEHAAPGRACRYKRIVR